MSIILQSARNVFVKTFFPGRLYNGLAIFYCKNAMNIQLGIGI